ncbi:hypothetical protein H5T87_06100 [bacterium]|nr:hypothetical protein [bacterium]
MTSRFINLIVNVQPKILKWDPNNPANCNITFSYSLASAHDSDKMRSSLTIGEHNVVMTDVNRFKATYILQDTKNASQAGVDVYDPDLQKLTGVTDGTAVSPAENSIDIDVQIDVGGTYRFLFWAIDDHPETDKAHRRKPALEVNKNPCLGTAVDFGISETEKAARDAAESQDRVYFPIKDALQYMQIVNIKLGDIVPKCKGSGLEKEIVPLIALPQNNPQLKLIGEGYYKGVLPPKDKKDFVLNPPNAKKLQIDRPASWVLPVLPYVNLFTWVTHAADNYGTTVRFGENTN